MTSFTVVGVVDYNGQKRRCAGVGESKRERESVDVRVAKVGPVAP